MNFTKMNGAGNDFVITDNRITKTNFTPKTIAKLCDRNRGIGADGFMSVESPENDGDYRMRYYNADGNEAEMCGNGARCFARFVFNNDNAIAFMVKSLRDISSSTDAYRIFGFREFELYSSFRDPAISILTSPCGINAVLNCPYSITFPIPNTLDNFFA